MKVENVKLVEPKAASLEGIEEGDKIGMKNYPNPFHGITTIQIPGSSRTTLIKVYDLVGRLVDVKTLHAKSDAQFDYNAKSDMNGIFRYFIKDDNDTVYKGIFVIR